MRLPHRWTDYLRTVAMAAVVALTATAARPMIASAQGMGGGQGGGGGRMMAALFDGITLTDVERKSIDSIRTAYQAQMQQARSSGDRSQMRDLMQKQDGDFRNVLTPDQQATFDKNLATMRSRMRGGAAGGGNPPSGGNPNG
jgi:Spy/CpxP family protein refolding chaperone